MLLRYSIVIMSIMIAIVIYPVHAFTEDSYGIQYLRENGHRINSRGQIYYEMKKYMNGTFNERWPNEIKLAYRMDNDKETFTEATFLAALSC